jgi:hypothetical protein
MPKREVLTRKLGNYYKPDDEKAAYIPTQDDIAAACAEIQAGWTEQQRESRITGAVCERMEVMRADLGCVRRDVMAAKRRAY